MTARARITQAELMRAIRAAEACGKVAVMTPQGIVFAQPGAVNLETAPRGGKGDGMIDLVERLTRWGQGEALAQHYIGQKTAREDCAEAAARIAELEAEVARLREKNARLLSAGITTSPGTFLPPCECGMTGPCMWSECKSPLLAPPPDKQETTE